MKEIITVGSEKYTATNVDTGISAISFTLTGLTEDEAKAVFKNAGSLTVGDGETVYGEYPDVEFESITIGAGDEITVTMHIPTGMEKQIRELQTSQAEQDEALAELMYGGGEA